MCEIPGARRFDSMRCIEEEAAANSDNGCKVGNAQVKNWVEISGTRLVENFRATRTAAGAGVETLAGIKADGYGHDAMLCAPVLTKAGARWLGVTDVEEGAKVRAALGEGGTRIMVMSGVELA